MASEAASDTAKDRLIAQLADALRVMLKNAPLLENFQDEDYYEKRQEYAALIARIERGELVTDTTAAPGTEPRAYHLRPESELIEAANGTTDTANTARRERIERRAWEFYMQDPKAGMRPAIQTALWWDELCQELIQ